MRTFIAIELPQEIREFLSLAQAQLKATGADIKWVEPQNIHLTLKFLGEIDKVKSEKIIKIIEEVAKDNNAFEIRISSFGAFPKINFPRVIWTGIDSGDKEARVIAKELEEKIEKIGIPKEVRPFSSHITLGRTRSTLNREKLAQGLFKLTADFGGKTIEFRATKITLFKSTLTPTGPIYEILKEANLTTI